jgi:hypothetical protein
MIDLLLTGENSESLVVNVLYVPCRHRADFPLREQLPNRRSGEPVSVANGSRRPATDEIQLDDSFMRVTASRKRRDLSGKTDQVALDREAKDIVPNECKVHSFVTRACSGFVTIQWQSSTGVAGKNLKNSKILLSLRSLRD